MNHVGRLGALWMTVVVGSSCGTSADGERLGDEAYGAARYRDALGIYQEAIRRDPDGRLWAKIGAAALRIGDLSTAADAYLRLAGEDPTRVDEAAEGLEIAAHQAERAGNARGLDAAVAGLMVVAPERIAGRFALALARRPGSEPADLVALLPGAIAVATHPRTVDSLLGVYATALQETDACDAARPVARAVIRRSRDHALETAAWETIAACTDIWPPPVPVDTLTDSLYSGAP